jgi:MOSC domain-containing protein YiiM
MVQHDSESTQPAAAFRTERDGVTRPEDHQRDSRDRIAGKLERIWIKRAKGGPMDPVSAALLELTGGLRGNANRGGKRQVTLISSERWAEMMDTLGADVPPSARRANLLVSGLDLENSRGRVLRVGTTRLLINGETRPCEQMEAAHPGLQEVMRARWGGGAFAEVVDAGEIRVGDDVAWA